MTASRAATQDLIDRASQGDAAARSELFERYREYLLRMVTARLDRRLAPRVDASDIVQEALADAAQRMDAYLRDRPLPFFGWLRQLAGERMIDAQRRHIGAQRRSITREQSTLEPCEESAVDVVRRLLANDTSPSNRLVRQERDEELMAALASLSPRDREVLVMRHHEQLSPAEIAEALGVTEWAVKSRLLRALIRIRDRLENNS
jgi:RNA polymerase sigma-70 factor, ECF subfamily